ncbi:YybH family protein [Streptomyces sp. NPDC002952]|uniref:YybH family protein n=1 Tax=Streptomyces sp. NPDC002952 TaxID=3364673 RepID=UPI0036B88AB9
MYAMIKVEDVDSFVRSWEESWNAKNLEKILSHFSEDVVFRSPVAQRIVGGDGVLHGKDQLRSYWAEGLKRVPNLQFTVREYYVGVNCLLLNYFNQSGVLVSEFFVFEKNLIVEGYGTYPVGSVNPAGVE